MSDQPTPRKFRKKPVVIEAMHFDGSFESAKKIHSWANCSAAAIVVAMDSGDGTLTIRTLEGDMTASAEDWIIRGVKGEFYPVRNDIFEATYEPVE